MSISRGVRDLADYLPNPFCLGGFEWHLSRGIGKQLQLIGHGFLVPTQKNAYILIMFVTPILTRIAFMNGIA